MVPPTPPTHAAPSAAAHPSLPPPPHRTEPVPEQVTGETFTDWTRAVARGFQEAYREESAEIDRRSFEDERCFGFTVEGRWVATFGSLARQLQVPGGVDVATSAVTVVTVHSPYRRRGLLSAMMRRELEECRRRGEPVATLWASESLIYGRYGFGPAVTRHLLKGTSRSLRLLPGVGTSGSVEELTREQYAALARRLHPSLREGRPGTMSRASETGWDFPMYDAEHTRADASELRFLAHFDDAGEPDGIATYRFKEDYEGWEPNSEVRLHELWAEDPAAYASLWRYLLELDLTRRFRYRNAATDEPLRLIVTDHRAVQTEVTDALYVRLVDLPAALRARAYSAALDVVLEVEDDHLPENSGRWRLTTKGEPGSTVVERTDAAPDLSLGVLELGTVYLGGTSLRDLHRVARVTEHTPGAVADAATAFSWHRAPWCPDFF